MVALELTASFVSFRVNQYQGFKLRLDGVNQCQGVKLRLDGGGLASRVLLQGWKVWFVVLAVLRRHIAFAAGISLKNGAGLEDRE